MSTNLDFHLISHVKQGRMNSSLWRIIHNLLNSARALAGRCLHRTRIRRLLRELDARQLAELGLSSQTDLSSAPCGRARPRHAHGDQRSNHGGCRYGAHAAADAATRFWEA
jgi:hypothetical protein